MAATVALSYVGEEAPGFPRLFKADAGCDISPVASTQSAVAYCPLAFLQGEAAGTEPAAPGHEEGT